MAATTAVDGVSRAAVELGNASAEAVSDHSTSSSASRQDKSTSTAGYHKGGDVEYHVGAPPAWSVWFMLGTPLLCFLNGCSYYLFWRSKYQERSATPHLAVSSDGLKVSPFFTSSTSTAAPSALYGVTAGIAFAFIFTQWVIQESAQYFIAALTPPARAAGLRRCGVLFEITFLPVTIAQMVLIGYDYHLYGKGKLWLLQLFAEEDFSNSRGGEREAAFTIRAALFSAAGRYTALWIVSFLLTTTAMVIVASAMWTDVAVAWLQRGVFSAYLRAKYRRKED